MNGQAARIANIGHVVEQLQSVDETLPGICSARQFETNQSALTTGQVLVRQRLFAARGTSRLT